VASRSGRLGGWDVGLGFALYLRTATWRRTVYVERMGGDIHFVTEASKRILRRGKWDMLVRKRIYVAGEMTFGDFDLALAS